MEVSPIWFLITRLADAGFVLPLLFFTTVYLLYRTELRKACMVWVVLLGAQLLVQLLKYSTNVPRKEGGLVETIGSAFPSAHAATAAALYGLLGYWLWQRTGNRVYAALGILIPLLVAFSRVMLQVHTPLQVVVGLLIGWGCVFALYEHERFSK